MVALTYAEFLNRSKSGLIARGAEDVLPPDGRGPDWTAGWDQVLLSREPGSNTLYAFTCSGDLNAKDLSARLDRLSQGLAGTDVLALGPLKLTAVVAFPSGADQGVHRAARRLAPSAYYPGLRPSTWTVDLAAGTVRGPRFSSSAEVRAVLEGAASPAAPSPWEEDPGVLQQRHHHQLGAFQRLMSGRQPVVTYALIAVNVAIFLVMYTSGALNSNQGIQSYGAVSAELVERGEWWRLLTSMFLHASFAHILFNMTSLFAVGTLAERLYGSTRFLLIYLGAGIIGGLASFTWALVAGNPAELGLGASGAIFGIAGALLTVRFQPSDVIPLALRQRVSSAMAPLVAISLPLSYALTPNVDNSAHIGGLLGGMALSFVFPLTRRASESP